VISDHILEEVAHTKYLGSNVSYNYGNGIKEKLQALVQSVAR
jgi:hypothetical protein